jgi:hypothetical protein
VTLRRLLRFLRDIGGVVDFASKRETDGRVLFLVRRRLLSNDRAEIGRFAENVHAILGRHDRCGVLAASGNANSAASGGSADGGSNGHGRGVLGFRL